MELRRGLDEAQIAARAQNPLYPCTFVFVDWPDQPVHVFSGTGTINWNGHTWNGVTTRDGTVADMVIPETGDQIAPREAMESIKQRRASVGNTPLIWLNTGTSNGGFKEDDVSCSSRSASPSSEFCQPEISASIE